MANGTSYRRGSVFGALLLIAVGGLFLYTNFTPEFSPWPLIALYWPVLLIALGGWLLWKRTTGAPTSRQPGGLG